MVRQESRFIADLLREIDKVIVGQRYMIERLLIGLLSDGHVLVEGVPGLAKTTAVKTLSQAIQTQFQRIQFTPDLLPADLIGTQIYQPKTSEFTVRKGPVFTNILLADEINRAPAKVQSALLEAMQEKQVSIGDQTFQLPKPFLVLATQNPIEQEGTYPLPEAQVDRFMLKLSVTYPAKAEELSIMRRMATGQAAEIHGVIDPKDILKAREAVSSIYMDEKIEAYIVDVVFATRDPKSFGLAELEGMIQYGASPRASIYLNRAARAHAFLQGRGYVTPQDVKTIGFDVLRHRVILTYEAEAEEMSPDAAIKKIFDRIEVP
ncbi:MAG: AAA family ATPase [Nitrospinae bacterium]|nr:AAA family ATPase [Nitrospinota bacterium]